MSDLERVHRETSENIDEKPWQSQSQPFQDDLIAESKRRTMQHLEAVTSIPEEMDERTTTTTDETVSHSSGPTSFTDLMRARNRRPIETPELTSQDIQDTRETQKTQDTQDTQDTQETQDSQNTQNTHEAQLAPESEIDSEAEIIIDNPNSIAHRLGKYIENFADRSIEDNRILARQQNARRFLALQNAFGGTPPSPEFFAAYADTHDSTDSRQKFEQQYGPEITQLVSEEYELTTVVQDLDHAYEVMNGRTPEQTIQDLQQEVAQRVTAYRNFSDSLRTKMSSPAFDSTSVEACTEINRSDLLIAGLNRLQSEICLVQDANGLPTKIHSIELSLPPDSDNRDSIIDFFDGCHTKTEVISRVENALSAQQATLDSYQQSSADQALIDNAQKAVNNLLGIRNLLRSAPDNLDPSAYIYSYMPDNPSNSAN